MNIKLITNAAEGLRNELSDVIRAFEPYVILDDEAQQSVTVDFSADSEPVISIFSDFASQIIDTAELTSDSDSVRKRNTKRRAKRALYFYLSDFLKVSLPYGSLTGIRPTKIYYELLEEKVEPFSVLTNYFGVSERKARLVGNVVATQQGIYNTEKDRYNTFVNIPFCPTRCSYCSFISDVVDRVKGKLGGYVNALVRDIEAEKQIMPIGKRRSIYVGGGTPTSIPVYLLDRILTALDAKGEEFTVEAGRPDTITPEILDLLKAKGVTRISVNPQSFNDKTLPLIGRKGSANEVVAAYKQALLRGFDVNMDLISSLPGESEADFRYSVDRAIDLSPDNITVHSLSIKRGSKLCLDGYSTDDVEKAVAMNDYAASALEKAGYSPYYMYRQKNTVGRLENVGYTKPSKACVYNVDIMEETHSVYASGAGAISKRVSGNLITRLAEAKDIFVYPERVDEYLEKKKDFFA